MKGDIWYFRKPAPQSERFADTVLVAHGPNVWRVTDRPERPVLGRRARQSKLEALARDFESASLEVTRADERQRALEAELRALEDLRLKLAEIARDRRELATLDCRRHRKVCTQDYVKGANGPSRTAAAIL